MGMTASSDVNIALDAALKRAAEREMRRVLPPSDDITPAKRSKWSDSEAIGRFYYGADKEMSSGMAGFLVFSDFRRQD